MRIVAVVFLALGGVAACFVGRVGTDNRMERWVSPRGTAAVQYAHFREQFGGDQFILAAISGRPLFEAVAFDRLLDAQRRVEGLPGVRGVTGLPALFRDLFGGENLDDLHSEAASPFYRRLFLSDDEQVMGILIDAEIPAEPASRTALIHQIEEAFSPVREYGFRVDFVGPPVLNAALDEFSATESARCFPPALAGAMIVLLLLLRSLRGALICAVCSGWSVLLTVGLMGVFHRSFNMVTSVLPPLLWVLSVSYGLHILSQYERRRRELPETGAILEAFRDTWNPILFSGLTTAIGFLSLVFTDMAPVREKGVFSAIGIMISVGVSLSLAPALIGWLRVPALAQTRVWRNSLLERSTIIALSRPWSVLVTFAALIVACCVSLRFVTAEGDPLSFLPEQAPVVQSYRYVADHLSGLSSLELVVRVPNLWTEPRYWPAIESITKQLSESPSVSRVISPLDILKKANQWEHDFDPAQYTLPATHEEAQRLVDGLNDTTRRELRRFVSPDGHELRLSVLVNRMESSVFLDVARNAQTLLATLPEGMSGYTTGIVQQLVESQRGLVVSQVASFGFTFLLVFACIWIGVRSWRLMLVSVAPSVLPILTAFACMAVARIPLDAATVMVANVALGIAADNIIHLLAAYSELRKQGLSSDSAVRESVMSVGPAISLASIATCIGFFALCRSMFIPIRYFGALTGAALLVGLVADLLLAPAILVVWGRIADRPGVVEQRIT